MVFAFVCGLVLGRGAPEAESTVVGSVVTKLIIKWAITAIALIFVADSFMD